MYPYSNRICPSTRVWHVHSSTQDRACVEVSFLNTLFTQEFHSKELGSILVRSRIKKITRFSVHTIHSVFENFHSSELIQKSCRFVCRPSPDTCGWGPYPKEKVVDSKISGCGRGRSKWILTTYVDITLICAWRLTPPTLKGPSSLTQTLKESLMQAHFLNAFTCASFDI